MSHSFRKSGIRKKASDGARNGILSRVDGLAKKQVSLLDGPQAWLASWQSQDLTGSVLESGKLNISTSAKLQTSNLYLDESFSFMRRNMLISEPGTKHAFDNNLDFYSSKYRDSSSQFSRLLAMHRSKSGSSFELSSDFSVNSISTSFASSTLKSSSESSLHLNKQALNQELLHRRRIIESFNVRKHGFRRLVRTLKYIFLRWFSLVNVCELLFITILLSICSYQTFDTIADYLGYPTEINMQKALMNKDSRLYWPGLTLCNNNRFSRESLRRNFPDMNETEVSEMIKSAHKTQNFEHQIKSVHTDWKTISRYLTNGTIYNSRLLSQVRHERFIEKLQCTGSGNLLPCVAMRRVESVQKEMRSCVTLFHDKFLNETRDEAVRIFEDAEKTLNSISKKRKEEAIEHNKKYIPPMIHAEEGSENIGDMDAQPQGVAIVRSLTKEQRAPNIFYEREIVRLRLNFEPLDYMDLNSTVGALVAIHARDQVGMITHDAVKVEPGYWYTFIVNKNEHKKLAKPYKTACHDYTKNNVDFLQVDLREEPIVRANKLSVESDEYRAVRRQIVDYLQAARSRKPPTAGDASEQRANKNPASFGQLYEEYLRSRTMGMVSAAFGVRLLIACAHLLLLLLAASLQIALDCPSDSSIRKLRRFVPQQRRRILPIH